MESIITINNPETAIKLTKEEAAMIGIKDPGADQQPGEIETRGPWNVISKYKAIAIAANFGKHSEKTKVAIFGPRTLSDPQQSGYQLEGRVSINGDKYTAFTSSQLFEIEGHLIDVAVIFARIDL